MSLISKMRRQFAVYWAPSLAADGSPERDVNGNATFAAPIELRCRWDDDQQLFRDGNGSDVVSAAVVYPDQVLKMDGVLWEGRLADVIDEDDPFANQNAYRIRAVGRNPNLKATEFLHTVYL